MHGKLTVKATILPSQQTQRHFHNIATTANKWLYRRCQFVRNESFSDVSRQRCGNVVPTF